VRDPDDIYTIHVDVPPGADRIAVDFDTLLENTISAHQLLLAWNTTVLYPLDIDKLKLMIEPAIILPQTWKQGSSLHVTSESGGRVNFAAVSLERLIDSPVLAGEFFRSVPLLSPWPAQLDITGDSQAAVNEADDAHAFELFSKLVDQDKAMFGFRHSQPSVRMTGIHFLKPTFIRSTASRPRMALRRRGGVWCTTPRPIPQTSGKRLPIMPTILAGIPSGWICRKTAASSMSSLVRRLTRRDLDPG
jgi:Peptidase M61 N-terminal domain